MPLPHYLCLSPFYVTYSLVNLYPFLFSSVFLFPLFIVIIHSVFVFLFQFFLLSSSQFLRSAISSSFPLSSLCLILFAFVFLLLIQLPYIFFSLCILFFLRHTLSPSLAQLSLLSYFPSFLFLSFITIFSVFRILLDFFITIFYIHFFSLILSFLPFILSSPSSHSSKQFPSLLLLFLGHLFVSSSQ